MEKDLKQLIEEYLQQKGWEFKESGNEQFLVRQCPVCGADRYHHFYIGQYTGLWDCKACGERGNFNQLREKMGDSSVDMSIYENATPKEKREKTYREPKFDIPLQHASRLFSTGTEALKYLTEERKLSEQIIKEFKLGVTPEGNISIPIYEGGKLVNIRYRFAPQNMNGNQRYTQEKGCRAALYNSDALTSKPARVYITEGELDALHLIQRGIRNTVSTTLGASSFPKAWVDQFEDIKEIYFVYDTDEEGVSGAKKAAEALGVDRCFLVSIPAIKGQKKTDVTDFFVKSGGTKEQFLDLTKTATPCSAPIDDEVKHISEFSLDLRTRLVEGEHFGLSTGYDALDEAMGGLREGRMVIVSGLTNTGKSSFATNICLNLAHRAHSSFYFSLEMPPIDIVKKVLQLEAKLTNVELRTIKDPSKELARVDDALDSFKDYPIYLYAGSGTTKYEIFEKAARFAVEKHGIECIFVDHLHYFVQDYNKLTAETSKLVRQIKQLAMELKVPIVLLAHLNRGGRSKQRTGLYYPSLADLRDSGAVEQDADQVLFVCRDSEAEKPEEREKAVIKIAKNRDGQAGGRVEMTFSTDITTFIENGAVSYEIEETSSADIKRKAEMDQELEQTDIPF